MLAKMEKDRNKGWKGVQWQRDRVLMYLLFELETKGGNDLFSGFMHMRSSSISTGLLKRVFFLPFIPAQTCNRDFSYPTVPRLYYLES